MIIMAMIVIHFTAIVRTSTSYNSVEFQVVRKINKRNKIKEKYKLGNIITIQLKNNCTTFFTHFFTMSLSLEALKLLF